MFISKREVGELPVFVCAYREALSSRLKSLKVSPPLGK